MEGLDEMLAVVDREYRYVLANRAFLKYYRSVRGEIEGLRVSEVMGAQLFEMVIKERLDAAFSGEVVRYELSVANPEMGVRDLLASLFPIAGPAGVERVAVIVQTLGAQAAEEALRESEQRFNAFMDNTPAVAFMRDDRAIHLRQPRP